MPAGPPGSLFYLGGDVTNSTPAPGFHNLVTSGPSDIALPNFDTDRDAFPGVVIAKDAAGIGGSDPTKVLKFSGGFVSQLEIDSNVHVDLFGAAKDFDRKDIDVEVGLYKCGAFSGCTLIDVDEKKYRHADGWQQKRFHFHGVDETITVSQWIEVRVAVLDSSDDDGWFAFGTADYNSRLTVD